MPLWMVQLITPVPQAPPQMQQVQLVQELELELELEPVQVQLLVI